MIRTSSIMRRLLHWTIVASLAMLAACGEKSGSTPAPPPGGAEPITGRERVGWTQQAEGPGELASYRYALYVDGQRRVLEGETCSASSGTDYDCSAPLPALGAGRHTLELAAFFSSGDTIIEGPRSPALQVTVAAVTAPADPDGVQGGSLVSSDGLRLYADILVRDLADPADLAVASDGRVFVAEETGHVRVISPDSATSTQPAAENVFVMLRESVEANVSTLLSIALMPEFSRTGLLQVAYVTSDRDRRVLRLARFREREGVLGQAAMIASHPVPGQDLSALMRIGPDGKMYVGIGSGSDIRDAQNPSAASGKILRLQADGSTPDDNPSKSPIFSSGHRDPRGLAWRVHDGSLWEVERDAEGDEVNRIRPGANYGWPLVRRNEQRPGTTSPAFILPVGTEPSGMAAIDVVESPLFGDFIVSALGGRDLLRIRFGEAGQPRVEGQMLQGQFGRIRQVAAGADGALFIVTANRDAWGYGRDMLVRIRIAPQ